MKKIKILFLLVLCLLIIDVKADNKAVIISHQVMVTNKEGTTCYSEGKKTEEVIPYKTMLTVSYDIVGSYINVVNDKYDCDVKYSDVSSNTQKFSLDTKGVEKITSLRAIVLPNTGLNMRIGPAVTYAKRITIPQNTIIDLTYKAGTYWYYTEYNGVSGWVTAMNKYLGYDYDKVLVNYEKTKVYGTNGVTVLTTIPENTNITDYIKLESINEEDFKYYVNYNGIKGYIKDMLYKTNGNGTIKLIKDVDIKDEKGNPVKRMSAGSELEYSMQNEHGYFYFPTKNALINLNREDYEYVKEAKLLVKDKGYLGEGIFGEEKKEREKIIEPEEKEEEKKDNDNNTRDLIIIILLAGILISLIVLVIVKIVGNKNNKKEYNNNPQ